MSSKSPWEVLGVTPDASPEELRARYTELIKLHPPDRNPTEFERIRKAWDRVRDPRAVARERLFGPSSLANLSELEEAFIGRGPPVGPKPWLAALKDLSR